MPIKRDPDFQRGQKIDDYILEEPLGAGQDGEVWRASKISLGKTFALKFLNSIENEEKRIRFVREINILAGLNHPNIISINDRGEAWNPKTTRVVPYYVMEILEAQSIDRYLRTINPNWALITFCELFQQVAAAVTENHINGVSHGDIKPANIMIIRFADPVAKLTDFGFGLRRGEVTEKREEYPASSYRAPEGISSHEADIYRLGRTFRDCIAETCLSNADRALVEEPIADLVERTREVALDDIRLRFLAILRTAYRKPYHC